MKKIYIDLNTGSKIADNLPELDTMLEKPERVGAFIVPFWENYGTIAEYSRAERVAIW